MYNTGELQGFTPSMLQADYTNYSGMLAFIFVSIIGMISLYFAFSAVIDHYNGK